MAAAFRQSRQVPPDSLEACRALRHHIATKSCPKRQPPAIGQGAEVRLDMDYGHGPQYASSSR
ncbi:MAG: hypothetical protein ACYTAS_21010, partial [Planctomycetota bacterium]